MPVRSDAFPLISVVLTTRDRPRLLPIALECYRQQTYANRELIVVDDGDRYPVDRRQVEDLGGQIVRAAPGTILGTKLNYGIERSRGVWCQKMDDDDWYGPGFLEAMMAAVLRRREEVCRPALAMLNPFLFFEVGLWEVRCSTQQNSPGATLMFAREDWEQQPFRAVRRDEDVWFVRDHTRAGLELIPVRALESFLAVRHGCSTQDRGHTWTHQGNGQILEKTLQDRPLHRHTPEELLPEWALQVYRSIHQESASTATV